MECREFRGRLAQYLGGSLGEPDFGRMARHESQCPLCHELAAEGMPDPPRPLADAAWTAAVLARTARSACRIVERLLAEEVDTALPAARMRSVLEHLATCPECRALAHALRRLPDLYLELPQQRADREFTRAVLRRTSGGPASIWVVLRAMWRQPGLLWEGALICSLIAAPLFGRPAARLFEAVEDRTEVVQAAVATRLVTAESVAALRERLLQVGHRADTIAHRVIPSREELSAGAHAVHTWVEQNLVHPGARPQTTGTTTPVCTPAAPEAIRSEGGNDELRKP